MLKILNNFLISGHQFSENDHLQKFRFGLLNTFMVIVSFFTLLNFLASFFGVIDFGRVFEKAMLVFLIANISATYLLRKDKFYYHIVVSFFIISSLILFYFILLTRKEDEFRLIAFFLGIFITYVLLGKNIGILLALFILVSIIFISKNYDLELSPFAYSTFFTFFVIFAVFLYFFLRKVERDSLEFEILNNKLQESVKQEARQRMEQEQMLLRQCRMANMGEMLDSIAHQWRQPLMHINSILLNMEVALENKDAKNQIKDNLENKIDEVATLTAHMSQTIEDFRGLFSVEREYTNFTLQEMINDVLALLKNNLDYIELEFHIEDDISIFGHRSELMQVIIIVLSNSIEVLNIREVKKKKIIINIKTSDESALISIEDNAGGVDLENIDIIFDPYFTTKELSGGTGLGLYVAKIIIEQNMGGKISVSNAADGAKFLISLIKLSSVKV